MYGHKEEVAEHLTVDVLTFMDYVADLNNYEQRLIKQK